MAKKKSKTAPHGALVTNPNDPTQVSLPIGFYKLPLAANVSRLITAERSLSFRLELPNTVFVDVHLSAKAAETLYGLLGTLAVPPEANG